MKTYNYIPDLTTEVIKKYNQTRKQFGVGENSPEQTCIDKGYLPTNDNTIPYDRAIETQSSVYVVGVDIVNKNYTNTPISDETLRSTYEENMTRVMQTEQYNALGDPALHRFTQGMSRVTHLVNARQQGATLNQEEIDYIDGSEIGLDYQEANATMYSNAVSALALLSGQAIVDYPMPDFSMNPATHSGYQPYLDYLNAGYVV